MASATATPMPRASQRACRASLAAPTTSPRPRRTATRTVVPYERKLNTHTTVFSTVEARARPPRGTVPRRPTTAVSVRT